MWAQGKGTNHSLVAATMYRRLPEHSCKAQLKPDTKGHN